MIKLVALFYIVALAIVVSSIHGIYSIQKEDDARAAAREARRKMKSYRIHGSGWMLSSTKSEGSPGHSPVRDADIGIRIAR